MMIVMLFVMNSREELLYERMNRAAVRDGYKLGFEKEEGLVVTLNFLSERRLVQAAKR